MSTAVQQKASLARRRDRSADIHPDDRAARGFAYALRHGNNDCRAGKAFLKPASNNADNPGMPARTRGDNYSCRHFTACLNLGRGRLENIRLDRLAFLVEFTQT